MRRLLILIRSSSIAATVGVAAGLIAQLLYVVLPSPWQTLANTSALWGLVAFVAVAATRSTGLAAAAHGALCLVAMVAAFALTAEAPTVREVLQWFVVGALAGGVFGGAATRGRSPAAMGLVGGVVAGEAVYGVVLIGGPQWWLELVVGVAVCCWSRRPVMAIVLAAALTLVLFGAYTAYDVVATP